MGKKVKGKNKGKDVAKKAGILYGTKKVVGKVSKLAVVAGVGAAVVKILRRDSSTVRPT